MTKKISHIQAQMIRNLAREGKEKLGARRAAIVAFAKVVGKDLLICKIIITDTRGVTC